MGTIRASIVKQVLNGKNPEFVESFILDVFNGQSEIFESWFIQQVFEVYEEFCAKPEKQRNQEIEAACLKNNK